MNANLRFTLFLFAAIIVTFLLFSLVAATPLTQSLPLTLFLVFVFGFAVMVVFRKFRQSNPDQK